MRFLVVFAPQTDDKADFPAPLEQTANFPKDLSVYDYVFEMPKGVWTYWMDTVNVVPVPESMPFNSIVVRTVDTVRYSWLLEQLILHGYQVLAFLSEKVVMRP